MYKTSQNYKNKILLPSTRHELQIYINDKEINHIYSYRKKFPLLNNKEFILGLTPEQSIEIEIDKRELPESYNTIKAFSGLEEEPIPEGIFTIQKPIEDDEYKVKIKAVDNMHKLDTQNYDGSILMNKYGGQAPLGMIAQDVCNQCGVELGSKSFLNDDKIAAVYDNRIKARVIIGYIAASAGGFACFGRDGKLYIKSFGENKINFDINLFGDYIWGDKLKISRVSYEDGILDYKFGDKSGATIYINQNNIYIIDEDQVKKIYEKLKGLEIYSFSKGKTIIDPAYDVGDILTIDGKDILYQGEIEYSGKYIANIDSQVQEKTEQESSETKENQITKERKVKSQIDQINGKITQIVEEADETSNKISEHSQTLNEITNKISDVEDLTVSGETTGTGKIVLKDLQAGDVVKLIIHPIATDPLFPHKGLYPHEGLFPARVQKIYDIIDRLFPRKKLYPHKELLPGKETKRVVFHNTTDDTYVYYNIQSNLYYIDNKNYDELVVDGSNEKTYVKRKTKINNGKKEKQSSTREDLSYIKITLTKGDYEIYMENIPAYIFVKCAGKNNLTDTFATHLELASVVTQTKDSITSEVSKKYATIDSLNVTNTEISTLKQTAEGIQSTVTRTQEMVVGDNLVINGNFSAQMQGWLLSPSGQSQGIFMREDTEYNWFNLYSSLEFAAKLQSSLEKNIKLEPNTEYTVSFRAYSVSDNMDLVFYVYEVNNDIENRETISTHSHNFIINKEEKKYEYTFTSYSRALLLSYALEAPKGEASYVNVTDIKIEKGSSATPYKPYTIQENHIISMINQTADGTTINGDIIGVNGKTLTVALSEKIGNDELSMAIQASPQDIRIAWNKINEHIQISNASFNILDENDKLLITYNASGMKLYNAGISTGSIGTGQYAQDASQKDLSFNLDPAGKFMGWFQKTNVNDDNYVSVLSYSRANSFGRTNEGIYADAPLRMGYNDIYLNDEIRMYGTRDTYSDSEWYNAIYFGDNVNSCFAQFNRNEISFFTNTGLLVNGSKVQTGSSDGRLKHDISDTEVQALPLLNQIKHRQFTWNADNTYVNLGYIAQELENIDSNLVIKNPQYDEEGNLTDNIYQVNLLGMLALATKSIQELSEKINEQQFEINTLNKKLGIEKATNVKRAMIITKKNSIDYGRTINYTKRKIIQEKKHLIMKDGEVDWRKGK